jgi:hypothetical protein
MITIKEAGGARKATKKALTDIDSVPTIEYHISYLHPPPSKFGN